MGKWRRFCGAGLLLAAGALASGCNRQDAECLGRIGNLVLHRAEALKQSGAAAPLPLPSVTPPEPEKN